MHPIDFVTTRSQLVGPLRQSISGFTKTGFLENSCFPTDNIQLDNMTIEQAVRVCANVYGFEVVVDDIVKEDLQKQLFSTMIKPEESVYSYLSNILQQVAVVLSHTPDGALLLTRAKASALLTRSELLLKGYDFGEVPKIGYGEQRLGIIPELLTPKVSRNILYSFIGSNTAAIDI